MRTIISFLVALAGATISTPTFAQEAGDSTDVSGSVGVATSYFLPKSFNSRISDEPMIIADVTVEHGDWFAYGYVQSGFNSPLNDASSEYGFEVGRSIGIDERTTVVVAAGRYANYAGDGWDAGDWYVRGDVTRGRVTARASVLAGDSDTATVGIDYAWPVSDQLTVTPSVTWVTAYGWVNPGLEAEYRLSDNVSLGAIAVYPNEGTGNRAVYGGISVTVTF